ncbi:TetR/AcrR family transcriptional regulator C-terminal domain-containing protein [Spelaeicoccus albus]|uniref:AcrR family transcriptional regulator n=1 Tax=Spelaeicoccus albus TaxID=1280376 RepID=A0A7Z0D3V5_9MICO|nr:TetR/AcrR family transcriptional regulator C-terminal domain-containing protein [Spelaeicoccus albus]NYI68387.1 AcrR family transcriptional regulator [Spelaeicoccus albus]
MTRTGSGRGHTRDDVVRTALHILDEYGLPDLTMRRLANALGVQPSALYWHFANKQNLLAELADRIVARAAADDPDSSWTTSVRAEAVALRDALLAYRDGAEVVAGTLALGLGSTMARDRFAAAVAAGGFDRETARRAAMALLHFVLGHVSYEQQRMQYDSVGVLADALPVGGADPTAEFTFGIDLIVAGLDSSRARR